MKIWEPGKAIHGRSMHWRIGPLDIWVKCAGPEWHVATERGEENRAPLVEDVEETEQDMPRDWRRWATEAGATTVKVTPLLPDRSVVVRPATPLNILPDQEARFFVGVPIWVGVGVTVKKRKDIQLCEEPALALSRSWFGTPLEGELCYALRTRAKRSLDDLTPAPHRAVCPVTIKNDSEDSLDVQRLCLRARHLSIYAGTKHLWTNEGRVVFKGEDALDRITYGHTPPPFDDANTLLSGPRDQPGKGFVAKTFSNLKAFTPFQ